MTKLKKISILIPAFLFIYSKSFSAGVLLWEINSNTTKVYLLGSIHVAEKSIYPLDERITKAYQASDFLVVEANVNNADPNLIKSKAYLPKGVTLDSVLKKENYEQLKKKFKEFMIPSVIYKTLKPWMAVMMITQLEMQKSGYDFSIGIDKHFLDITPPNKVMELESIEQQLSLLDNLGNGDQDEFVKFSLNDMENSKKQVDSMFFAWKNGDEKMLEDITLKDSGNKDNEKIMEAMLYNRNVNMVKKIEELLLTNKTYFVVVGAGHLLGDRGIVNKMKILNKYKIEKK
jgi:uncharacterized protein YbaP (TraB family)